jgi:hypothetical protein
MTRRAQRMARFFGKRFVHRVLHKAVWMLVLTLCAVWNLGCAIAEHHGPNDGAVSTVRATSEMPSVWQGTPLRPLTLSDVEQRFARHFPGTVARMTDGKQVLVLRTITKATRMLHPATDCYRGLGYRIHSEQLELQAHNQRWRCFVAERSTHGAKRTVRVCERIEDALGHGFTDTSAWYWASITGTSTGPWQAITVATPL